jgi:hypothetical protein
MWVKRLFVIVFVVAGASLGIPSQVFAAPSTPASLTAVRTVASQVSPGETKAFSVPMPWRANMVGVSYVDRTHSAKGVFVSARTHAADSWSSWQSLESSDSGASNTEALHASHRVTTDPIWVATADQIQVLITVLPGSEAIHDVRVHLINSMGDAHPQNVFMRFIHAAGRFLTMHAAPAGQPAQAATTQPAIISRAQWGANPAYLNLPCPGVAPQLKMAFIHHTDTTNSYTKSQSAGIVRGIYAYHTNSRGYCDIGYNFLIDKYGQIFEGRSGGITNNVIGAHTGGYNYESFGISLMGQYSAARPTSAMMTALVKLLAWRLDIAHVPATGTVYMTAGSGNDHTSPGTVVRLNRISGHRNVSYTNCPGNYVYAQMSWIRSHVNAMGLPKIYLPTQSTLNLRPDGDKNDELMSITAWFSASSKWTLSFIDPKGVVQRTFTGTGTGVKQYWAGTTATGKLVPTGAYRWTLTATDAAGHSATPASGVLNIVTSHRDGTLLSDATGRYVIDAGAARAVDPVAYASNFGTLAPVATGPNERARYTVGTPLGLRAGTLLVGPTGVRYIWSGGALRAFSTSPNTFTTLGYQAAAAISASQTYIDALPSGGPVTSVTTHPDGTALKSVDGKTFYVVDAGTLRPFSALARASLYRTNEVVTVTAGDLALPAGTAFHVRDGALIKAADGGAPWMVSDGTKHRFVSASFATLMGYTTPMMLTATAADIAAIPTGARIG